MGGGEPTPLLEDQLKERAQAELQQAKAHHESHARQHGSQLLGHLNALGAKSLTSLAEFNGRHYRLRVDVLPAWYARLYMRLHKIKVGKK